MERHNAIIETLAEDGQVSVKELVKRFKVSAVTIRKDLSALEERGLLYRTHGGATLESKMVVERNVTEKEKLMAPQKKAIALQARELISEQDTIILASGTTVLYLERVLSNFKNLTVLTSSLRASLELCAFPQIFTIQLGGPVRKSSSSIIGDQAEEYLKEFSCKYLFLGVDGIDLTFGMSTSNVGEAKLNQKMIKAAEKVVVLTDSTKLGKKGFARISGLEDLDILITDKGISEHMQKEIEELGINVIIATCPS